MRSSHASAGTEKLPVFARSGNEGGRPDPNPMAICVGRQKLVERNSLEARPEDLDRSPSSGPQVPQPWRPAASSRADRSRLLRSTATTPSSRRARLLNSTLLSGRFSSKTTTSCLFAPHTSLPSPLAAARSNATSLPMSSAQSCPARIPFVLTCCGVQVWCH